MINNTDPTLTPTIKGTFTGLEFGDPELEFSIKLIGAPTLGG
jgi:hypothetical protein